MSRRREQGFTLLEFAATVTLFTVIVGAVLGLSLRAQALHQQLNQLFQMQETGLRVLDRLCTELRRADPDSLDPLVPVNSPSLSVSFVVGHDGASLVMGDTVTYSLGAMAGEALDGVDNNGDGRVDEARLLFSLNGGDPVVIAENLLGLRISATPTGLAIEIDLGVVERDGTVVQRTYTRRVSFRNS